jgi:hypothetical protein
LFEADWLLMQLDISLITMFFYDDGGKTKKREKLN